MTTSNKRIWIAVVVAMGVALLCGVLALIVLFSHGSREASLCDDEITADLVGDSDSGFEYSDESVERLTSQETESEGKPSNPKCKSALSDDDLKNLNLSVKFYLYDDPSDVSKYTEISPANNESLQVINLKEGAVLKVLTHGFRKHANSSFPQEMKNVFLENTNHPVICVDWGLLAGSKSQFKFLRPLKSLFRYPKIVRERIDKVGNHIGRFIVSLKKLKIVPSLRLVHLIGHSLGAHVSGIAGITVQKILGEEGKIGRITGLDPAGPLFENKHLGHRLDMSDAEFVDIIHTSRQLGDQRSTGHVDFYPNSDSKVQPGCERPAKAGILSPVKKIVGQCDHSSAVKYYTKSITDRSMKGCHFEGRSEEEGDRSSENSRNCSEECDGNVVFGEYISNTTRGEYCLKIDLNATP